ncbi:hypothetical protein MUK70_19620 [Dyadobacter chenwenxiniae]|uniref:Uncharacterized protein n=1 Tax=Dyadobacter chenwenxiniae TaxID=2906456 RepID=A0A9X1TE85_9BACT|nr:hypothetical protein [Dyadobacter chenwenxiniae]MCF0061449.1 hypothetical protein [Dyadobacter chenwenxiniae]UON81272.1 hypothetical protein MUK70_19620 [Dyadobacter chenwenxiniae]
MIIEEEKELPEVIRQSLEMEQFLVETAVGSAKISQILNGKRQLDVPFLKVIHKKLGIGGNFILGRVRLARLF